MVGFLPVFVEMTTPVQTKVFRVIPVYSPVFRESLRAAVRIGDYKQLLSLISQAETGSLSIAQPLSSGSSSMTSMVSSYCKYNVNNR